MKQLIFILFLIIFSGITIRACSAPPYNPSRDFRQSRAVFIGKVIDITVDDVKQSGFQRQDVLYKIRFRVEKSWKGGKSEITIVSDNGKSQCGMFTFQEGETYLVYAQAYGERLAAWASSGSPSQILKPENAAIKKRLNQLNSYWFRTKANWGRFWNRTLF